MQPGINVFVTNHNPWPMSDRWDGIPIEFPTGKRVPVELEAAAHFFGFPVDDEGRVTAITPNKDYIMRRYGWNTASFQIQPSPEGKIVLNPSKAQENADLAFKNLVIEVKEYELVERRQADDSLPAPRAGARNDVPPTGDEPGKPEDLAAARRQFNRDRARAYREARKQKQKVRDQKRAERAAKREAKRQTLNPDTGDAQPGAAA